MTKAALDKNNREQDTRELAQGGTKLEKKGLTYCTSWGGAASDDAREHNNNNTR